MKLFTIFTNDERAMSHIRKMKRSLDRVAARIEDCEEWGLRILFDQASSRSKKPTGRSSRDAEKQRSSGDTVSGTSFLQRKKAVDEERRRAGARGAAAVNELYARLAKSVRSVHRRAESSQPGGRVVLDASSSSRADQ